MTGIDKKDLLGYLLVLNSRLINQNLSDDEWSVGKSHIVGCNFRLMAVLDEIEYQTKYYDKKDYCKELTLKKIIDLREHLNITARLDIADPLFVSMTETTAIAVYNYYKHLNEIEIDTEFFLEKFDDVIEKILSGHVIVNPEQKTPEQKIAKTSSRKEDLKKKIDELFSKKNQVEDAFQIYRFNSKDEWEKYVKEAWEH